MIDLFCERDWAGTMTESDDQPCGGLRRFIERWRPGAAERANYQLFLTELCDIPAFPPQSRHRR